MSAQYTDTLTPNPYNTVVKGGIVLSTGSAALRKAILPGLVLTLATALGVAFLL